MKPCPNCVRKDEALKKIADALRDILQMIELLPKVRRPERRKKRA